MHFARQLIILEICKCCSNTVQLSASGDNPLLKVVPPADRRGAQMKAPSERAPRGKYADGILEQFGVLRGAQYGVTKGIFRAYGVYAW